jgi:L-2-hydroxycarboxylate dehydrogenase (NAD+)
LRELRESKRASADQQIYTCGEKEYLAYQTRKGKGAPVDQVVQKQLCAMRDEQQLPYVFPFET